MRIWGPDDVVKAVLILLDMWDVGEDAISSGTRQGMLKIEHQARRIFFGLIVLKFYEKIGERPVASHMKKKLKSLPSILAI